jgi:hypothetical protein
MPDKFPFVHAVGESRIEYLERMARVREEALEWRQQQLDQQSSPVNLPQSAFKPGSDCTSWTSRAPVGIVYWRSLRPTPA